MTREQWLAHYLARAPAITREKWRRTVLLLRSGQKDATDEPATTPPESPPPADHRPP